MPISVNICESFVSIQGETSYVGLPFFFVRLTGCNLRCSYCDTAYAYGPGLDVAIPSLVAEFRQKRVPRAVITGGEPLLQPGFPALTRSLLRAGACPLLVETNGSVDISRIPPGATIIMDVKCPSSGESRRMLSANFGRLRPGDEVKFVISDRGDYLWARRFLLKHRLAVVCRTILFSPAAGRIEPSQLAKWIIEDRIPVRLQVQLHRILGMR